MIPLYILSILIILSDYTICEYCRTTISGQNICLTVPNGRNLKTWYDARNDCKFKNMILPEIYNHEEDDIFNNFIIESELLNDDIWMGGYISNLSLPVCNDASNNCSINITTPVDKYFTLLTLNTSIALYSVSDPSGKYGNYICKKINCTNNCYNVYINNVDYFTALNLCLQKNQRLATFESQSDLDQIKQLLKDSTYYWVDIKKIKFTWNQNDTNHVRFTNFACSLPTIQNDSCIVKLIKGPWGIRRCNDSIIDNSLVVCMSRKTINSSEFKISSEAEEHFCLDILGLGLLVCVGAFLWILSLIIVGVCCCCCCRGNRTSEPKPNKKSKKAKTTSKHAQHPNLSSNSYSESHNQQFDDDEESEEQTNHNEYRSNVIYDSEYANANV